MTVRFARNFQILLGCLFFAFLISLGVDAQTKDGKDGKDNKSKKDKNDKNDKNDPPGTGKYLIQLRTIFTAWDTNKDGKADLEELAHAYRGPTAKAFDPTQEASKLIIFPDYHIVKQLDKNTDWAVTQAEFDVWAKDHAEQLAEQEDVLERILMKQKMLEKENPKSKNFDKLKSDLKKEREQADRLQDKIQAMQKQIQQMKRDDGKDKKGK